VSETAVPNAPFTRSKKAVDRLLRKLLRPLFGALRYLLERAGYRVERLDQLRFFEPLLYLRLAKQPDFFFVQIGANDGVFHDPIREFVTRNHVAGIALEPLKDVYVMLVENYRNFPKVKPVNLGIHGSARKMDIHRVDPSKSAALDVWVRGIASFNESHHRVNDVPDEVMITETVDCVTLDELLRRENVTRIDLLQIDTEGYDYEIIKMIDFATCKPAIIHFEHGLPADTMSLAQLRECVQLLMGHGYLVLIEPYDATAYLPESV
jgi:FkbM family methyltransferase